MMSTVLPPTEKRSWSSDQSTPQHEGQKSGEFTTRMNSAASSDKTSSKDDRHDEEQEGEKGPILPRYRMVNFEQFQNRYSNEDYNYAIEAYVVRPSDIEEDIRQEKQRRNREEGMRSGGIMIPRLSVHTTEQNNDLSGCSKITLVDGIIQRVRIQSLPVLLYFEKFANLLDHGGYKAELPTTFMRPFRMLIYFHHKMKEALAELEARWAALEKERVQKASATSAADTWEESEERRLDSVASSVKSQSETQGYTTSWKTTNASRRVNPAHVLDAIMGSIEALDHLRCYIGFAEQHIMPISRLFEQMSRREVRFDDLWLLFKPGDIVFAKSKERVMCGNHESRGSLERETEAREPYQEIWRICAIDLPEDRVDYRPAKAKATKIDEWPANGPGDPTSFRLRCFYLDYDGSLCRPVVTRFTIQPYDNQCDITSLPCYPIRYLEDHGRKLSELVGLIKNFPKSITDNHLFYSGMTLEQRPDGNTPVPPENLRRALATFVESEVVIDFEEAYKACPWLRPKFSILSRLIDPPGYPSWRQSFDNMQLYQWDSPKRQKVMSAVKESVPIKDTITLAQSRYWLSSYTLNSFQTPSLILENYEALLRKASAVEGKTAEAIEKERIALREHDLVLLPTVLCGYVFREKDFFMLDLRKLSPVIVQTGVFESLKIPKEYKEMVRGLVRSHFEKKKIDRLLADISQGSIDQDIIQGKGKGLVILLHGVPGVGKTATAEAVARENKKPLFTVTYGDLGTDPAALESNLRGLFHLADRWNCVLLFDEADVFLAERSRTELKRNALVSVFLRVLEYYQGILFLTTNRVGSVDEAFKSRLHMMLYYPPLDRSQTLAIFKANVAKLREIEKQKQLVIKEPALIIDERSILRFAERHYDKNGLPNAGRWNGRQIKNAFQIAASLAHYKARASERQSKGDSMEDMEGDATVPVLDDTHFMKVEKATLDFSEYISQTRGFTDAKWAQMSALRNDEFQSHAPYGNFAARNNPAPYPAHTFGGAGAHHGGYGAGPMMDSYQPGGSFQADASYRGRSHHQGQAAFDEYGTGGSFYPGGHQSQPGLHDPSRHYSSGQMGQGSMPSRSPVPSTASPHGPGFRPAPGREDFRLPAQRGGNYERYSEVPRPAVHDDDGEDAYN